MSPKPPIRLGTALLVSNALLLCALENCAGYATNNDSFNLAYVLAAFLWSALTLWGLIHAGSLLYRVAFPARCPHCGTIGEPS